VLITVHNFYKLLTCFWIRNYI